MCVWVGVGGGGWWEVMSGLCHIRKHNCCTDNIHRFPSVCCPADFLHCDKLSCDFYCGLKELEAFVV